jgi:hypothetical protein
MQASSLTDTETKIIVRMVTALLDARPSDPVPCMYSFLKQIQQGVKKPKVISTNEVSQIINLRKQVELLEGKLNQGAAS